jgi:alpha-L-fucosidase
LNVGPQPDGEIEPNQAQRLHEIGEWLKRNGESVYGTRGGPWLPGNYGVSTHKGKFVYIHILKIPDTGTVTLPSLAISILRITDLSGKSISYSQEKDKLVIKMPAVASDTVDLILKVELAEGWNTSTVIPVQPGKGLLQ